MSRFWIPILAYIFIAIAANAQDYSSLRKSSQNANLFTVIRSGDPAKLEAILKMGINVNDSIDRYSLLMLAAMSGTLEEIKVLVAYGAEVNYQNRDSLTALWLAIPDLEKTIFLIEHGADIHAHSQGGKSMLAKLALMPGSAQLIHLFIAKGLRPNENNPGNILIANALYSADTSNLAIFLEAGLNVNAPDRQGNPPIIDVALNSCYPTIKMLLDHGAEFNVSDKKYKFTPLMNAAAAGDAATTNLLIQKGADLRMLDFAGYNALAWLALADIDNPEIVEQMCKGLGNQLYLKGKDGSDAFSWMEKKGNNKSVQVLSKYKHPQP